MKWLLACLVLLVYALHQDLWLWHDRSLVLGILPVGLAYHAAYCVLAAGTMAVLVKLGWPGELDPEDGTADTAASGDHA